MNNDLRVASELINDLILHQVMLDYQGSYGTGHSTGRHEYGFFLTNH